MRQHLRDKYTLPAAGIVGVLLFFTWTNVLGQAEIRMKNGSILYGEVKRLEFAELTLDTDDFDLIQIDWDPIAYMKAPGPFSIRLTNGTRLTGSLEVDSVNATVRGLAPVTVRRDEISSFEDFDTRFWDQFSAGVDVGANIVRGNNSVTSLSYGVSFGWADDKTEAYLKSSTIINEQDEGINTRRYTASVGIDRETLRRLRFGVVASYERDENQDLDYRIPLSANASYRAVDLPRARLDIVLGGGPTIEKNTGVDATSVIEGRSGFAFIGRPDSDTELDLSAYVLPSLFDLDRVRIESDLVFRVEVIEDLNVNINAYYRFNDMPPEGIKQSDYGITVGLGWSY